MEGESLIRLTKTRVIAISQTSISLVGLGLLVAITFHEPTTRKDYQFPAGWVGSIFIAICLLGIIAATSPSRCSRSKHSRSSLGGGVLSREAIRISGHHPTCGRFSLHVFQIRGKTLCLGCTGLAIGAGLATLGSLMYFFLNVRLEGVEMFIFWLGLLAVGVGLLQQRLFRVRKRAVHFILNVTFVVGAFLLLVGVSEINPNYFLHLYLFSLIVYWIVTRITMSQIEHENVCRRCGSQSCPFS